MDTNGTPAVNLVERKRQLVRDELADAAVKLLASQGFDETTVDQIAAEVGMSRRTFSRYFETFSHRGQAGQPYSDITEG